MGSEYGVGRGKVYPASKAKSLRSPLRRLIQSPAKLARRLDASPDAWILEIGCGPGYFSRELAASVPHGRLVLFDLQLEMLELATDQPGLGDHAVALAGDATVLPFRSASFDAVVVVLMLGEVPDRDGCLAEIRRILRPGGMVLFAETRRDSDFVPYDDLCAMLEDQRFDVVDRRGPPWEYTARFTTR